jgi:hypothetical protein
MTNINTRDRLFGLAVETPIIHRQPHCLRLTHIHVSYRCMIVAINSRNVKMKVTIMFLYNVRNNTAHDVKLRSQVLVDRTLHFVYDASDCSSPLFFFFFWTSIFFHVHNILQLSMYHWMTYIQSGTYKVRNEIETKRNQRKRNETKRNQRNETTPTKAKRNQLKQNELDWYEENGREKIKDK